MMLPYMEQTPLSNSLNFNLLNQGGSGYTGYESNTTGVAIRIAGLLCPSSPNFPGTPYGKNSPDNNYFASVGSSGRMQIVDHRPNRHEEALLDEERPRRPVILLLHAHARGRRVVDRARALAVQDFQVGPQRPNPDREM